MSILKPKSRQPLPSNAKKVFDGIIFDVYQWEQEMFDGSKKTFEKLVRLDTVIVIPVTEEGQIILIEEEQPGKAPYLSLPGGRVERGEDIEATAPRELLEETGYEADSIGLFFAEQPITKIEWGIYFFIAQGCKKVQEPVLESGEKISLKPVSFEEFVDLAAAQKIDEVQLTLRALEAKLDPAKMAKLRETILG